MQKITFILLVLLTGTVFGQNSADVTVGADIVSPIVVTATTPMNFGKVSNGATGTHVLNTNDSASGLVNLGNATPTSGGFTVNAADGYVYTVSFETSSILLKNSADETKTMTVDTFTTFPDISETLTGNASDQEYKVGATLHVTAGQATGTYTGTIKVTANYN
ncbi:DUF4402 domain-containing protein [Salinimicrobium catena]|uniref:DUF4402 domain-containing protein n=1 Tax=Salinimicrobium catena TaxID=390640 RepID=UPI002FE49DA9